MKIKQMRIFQWSGELQGNPFDNIIGEISKEITTRHSLKDAFNNIAFVSLIEPKNIMKP